MSFFLPFLPREIGGLMVGSAGNVLSFRPDEGTVCLVMQ